MDFWRRWEDVDVQMEEFPDDGKAHDFYRNRRVTTGSLLALKFSLVCLKKSPKRKGHTHTHTLRGKSLRNCTLLLKSRRKRESGEANGGLNNLVANWKKFCRERLGDLCKSLCGGTSFFEFTPLV